MMLRSFLLPRFGCFLHAAQSIKAAGIANIRQTTGYDLDEKLSIVSYTQVALCMRNKLRLSSQPPCAFSPASSRVSGVVQA